MRDGKHRLYHWTVIVDHGKVVYGIETGNPDPRILFPFYADGSDAIGKYSLDGLRRAIKHGRAFIG